MDVLVIRRRHNAVKLHCIVSQRSVFPNTWFHYRQLFYTHLEHLVVGIEAMSLTQFWTATVELDVVHPSIRRKVPRYMRIAFL